MLIHELSIAVQQDRERAVHASMTARRHLWGACTRSGLLATLRAAARRDNETSPPRVPASRPDLRPTR